MKKPLTAEMKKILKEAVAETVVAANYATRRSLLSRKLIDSSGKLTLEGWKQGVVCLPLREQCRALDIDHETIEGLGVGRQPEDAALKHYCSMGYSGTNSEGRTVLLLIRAAALNVFHSLNQFESRRMACQHYTEAQLTLYKDRTDSILEAIGTTSVVEVEKGLSEIYSHEFVNQQYFPGLKLSVALGIFEAIGSTHLKAIASAIMEDPYTYRAGWPDLTITDGSRMLWVEVKTNDKLHISQITTIHRMKDVLPGDIQVRQLL